MVLTLATLFCGSNPVVDRSEGESEILEEFIGVAKVGTLLTVVVHKVEFQKSRLVVSCHFLYYYYYYDYYYYYYYY